MGTHPWVFIPLFPGSHLLPPLLLRPRLILRLRLPLMPGTHTTDVLHIMVMDTASTGAIMGVMLATMVAMLVMAMVAIMVLDTDTMVESDVAMGTVPLCLALLENRKSEI